MNPARIRPLAPLAAAVTVALLAGGCTGTSTADPTLPPGTPSATPSSTPRPTPTTTASSSPSPTSDDTPMPTDDQLIELVNTYRNILLELPEQPIAELRDHIIEQADQTTTPDGSARDNLTTFADQLAEEVPIVRGTSHAAVLDDPQPDGSEWTATGCVATQGEFTFPETGEPAETDPFVGNYTEVELRVAPDDGGSWLMADYDTPDDPLERVNCVPPDIADGVRNNWLAVNVLQTEWATTGQSTEALQPLRGLVTTARFEELQAAAESETWTLDPEAETSYGLTLMSATPREVESRWCYDLSRDPTARLRDNESGEITDLSKSEPVVVEATWSRSSDGWEQGPTEVIAEPGEVDPCE